MGFENFTTHKQTKVFFTTSQVSSPSVPRVARLQHKSTKPLETVSPVQMPWRELDHSQPSPPPPPPPPSPPMFLTPTYPGADEASYFASTLLVGGCASVFIFLLLFIYVGLTLHCRRCAHPARPHTQSTLSQPPPSSRHPACVPCVCGRRYDRTQSAVTAAARARAEQELAAQHQHSISVQYVRAAALDALPTRIVADAAAESFECSICL